MGARGGDALGVVVADTDAAQAEAVADEIARLLIDGATVRDRQTGVRRADCARRHRHPVPHARRPHACSRRPSPGAACRSTSTRASASSTRTRSRTCWRWSAYLADPGSNLRAAAFLRSRIVRLSDEALKLAGAGHRRVAHVGRAAGRRWRTCQLTIASGCCWRATAWARGLRLPISCRRPRWWTACWPSRPTPWRSAAPASRRRART